MTPEEQTAWVQLLGKTREQQMAVLATLLRYAGSDGMSSEDRTICRTQLQRLRDEGRAWRTPCEESV